MEDVFRSYWWLLFPIGFFVFGAWDRWLSYKRSQDRLDLLRAYTNQGKDPPPNSCAPSSARRTRRTRPPSMPIRAGGCTAGCTAATTATARTGPGARP